ncbi:MAG: hypothetical protein P4L73_05010 [Caulobacteraceae bacterium]|nr:hypothetical protein [Caulobacteraceae bacterium]
MGKDVAATEAAAAVKRLQHILREMHPQAAEIVTGQVAIEREVRRLLAAQFASPDRLPKLKVVHVLRCLEASATDGWVLLVLNAARAFTDLRNAVAHGDGPPIVNKALAKLLDAMEQIGPRPDPATVRCGTVAIAIITALHLAFGEEATPAV